MKPFFVRNKKKILEMLAIVAALVLVSILVVVLLKAFNVIYFDDGMKFNIDLFDEFKNAWYGWVVLILFQILLTTVLCFVPGISMAFILLMQALFNEPWEAFLISFIGVMLTSTMMYLVGRFGGYRICAKLLGEEDCKRASELLNNKGVIFFPMMMMFPIFPDDALVMIAGTLKMSLKWFIPSIVVGRGIGVATITFGLSIIPFDKFTSPWHWILFVLACALLLVAIFYLANLLNNYLHNRNKGDGANKSESDAELESSEAAEAADLQLDEQISQSDEESTTETHS